MYLRTSNVVYSNAPTDSEHAGVSFFKFAGMIESVSTAISPSYQTQSASPAEIPDDVKSSLAECYRNNSIPNSEAPDARSIIDACETVAWVTINGNIAGLAGVIDPDREDWSGHVPRKFYELRTGKLLTGRKERRFLVVEKSHERRGIPSMLDIELAKKHEYMYAVTRSDVPGSSQAMKTLGYIPVAPYTDSLNVMYVLWINKVAQK